MSPFDTRPVDLVVLGDCNPDVLVLGGDVTPAFGQQEKLVGSIDLVVGGSAAITAVAAARLGLTVALVAAVGFLGFHIGWMKWLFVGAALAGFGSHGWLMLGVLRQRAPP